jgi:hypothetical protein
MRECHFCDKEIIDMTNDYCATVRINRRATKDGHSAVVFDFCRSCSIDLLNLLMNIKEKNIELRDHHSIAGLDKYKIE